MAHLDPVALITGASRGIGLAVATQLCHSGFRVALSARPSPELDAAAESLREIGPAIAIGGDLRDPAAPQRIARSLTAEWGAPSVVINNAGTAPSDRFDRTSDEDLDAVLDLHVRAPFRLIREFLPTLRETPDSVVIQVASTAGLIGFPFTSAYCAGKHAMVGMTRALAAELGKRPPACYALCPGFVDTEITRRAAAEIAQRGKQSEAEAHQALGSMNEIGRMHSVDEVAQAILDLVRNRPKGCVFNLDQDQPGFV